MLLELDSEIVWFFLWKSLWAQFISDSYFAFGQEEHVSDLIILIKDKAIFFWLVEFWRLKTEANFIKEILIMNLLSLTTRNKESSKSVNNIIKQIMQKYMMLYLYGTLFQKFVIYIHRLQSILVPIEREMTIHLINQNWRKWFTGKSSK